MTIRPPSVPLLGLALALLATAPAQAKSPTLHCVPRDNGPWTSPVRAEHWQTIDRHNAHAIVAAADKKTTIDLLSHWGYHERTIGAHPGQDFSLVKQLPNHPGQQVHVVFYRVVEQPGKQLESSDERRQRWVIAAHQEPSSAHHPVAHMLSAMTGQAISYRAGEQTFITDLVKSELARKLDVRRSGLRQILRPKGPHANPPRGCPRPHAYSLRRFIRPREYVRSTSPLPVFEGFGVVDFPQP